MYSMKWEHKFQSAPSIGFLRVNLIDLTYFRNKEKSIILLILIFK